MTAKDLGQLVQRRRKELAMNQGDLALVSATGRRFISDLENERMRRLILKIQDRIKEVPPDIPAVKVARANCKSLLSSSRK